MRILGFLSGAAFLAAMLAGASAQSADLHALYERHCAGCHAPHAGDFVRDSLERRDGGLVGRRNGREIRAFLAAGHGHLDAGEAVAMAAHLAAIAKANGLFQDKCRICHDRAADFARRRLILRDGRLEGRYTGRQIKPFLSGHGRLEAREIETILEMLARQLAPSSGD